MISKACPAPIDDPAATAADWVERLTSGDASEEEIARLREWVSKDPANRRAYEQARAIWAELPDTSLAKRKPALRAAGGLALAACLALALVLAPAAHDYSTGSGDVRKLVLADGSTVWLDSDSAVDVAFDERSRTIRLARGRIAIAAAAGDPRPLGIEADGARVTDIGTVFSVDTADGLKVAVSEGLVEVAKDGRTTRLGAGDAGAFDRSSPRLRRMKTGELAWRDGRIVFDQLPLGRALAELDRYYPGRVILTDGRLASRKVSGTLFSDKSEQGVEILARSQGLRVTRLPWLVLVRPAERT